MSSLTKPPASISPSSATSDTEQEFEAAVERVQRRQTTAPRKGFDEQREDQEPHEQSEMDTGGIPPLSSAPPGVWTPFSGD